MRASRTSTTASLKATSPSIQVPIWIFFFFLIMKMLLSYRKRLPEHLYIWLMYIYLLSVYKERIKSSNISSFRFFSQTELLWNPESNSCTTIDRLLIYLFYTITSLENMKSENTITYFVKSVTSVAAVILKMHPMSYDLKMLSCAFSTVLKIQFLQNSNPNANFFPLHLKLLFFSTKSQGQRSSWWKTDSFNHIYNIESNSDSRRGEYTGDLVAWKLGGSWKLMHNWCLYLFQFWE